MGTGHGVAATQNSGVGPSLSTMEFEEWLTIHKPNRVDANVDVNATVPHPYSSRKEFEKRKGIYEENRERWHRLNQIPGGATYGPDREPYADRTPQEFVRLVGSCYRETENTASATTATSDIGDARGGDNLREPQQQGEENKQQQRTRRRLRSRTGKRVIYANETRFSKDSTRESHHHPLAEAFTVMDVDWRAHAPPPNNSTPNSFSQDTPPPMVSYVTPVKNQGPHGTCWSFAAAENLEGLGVRQGFALANISEQEFISCCQECQGRSADRTFAWLLDRTGGVPALEATYPYVGNTSVPCRADTAPRAPTTLHSWGRAQDDDGTGDAILEALHQYGPMGLGVDAKCFHGYQAGIVRECRETSSDSDRSSDSDNDSDRDNYEALEDPGPLDRPPMINHAVLMVAAGTDLYYYHNDGDGDDKLSFPQAVDFFAIKNSWGAHWGEDGYVRIERGTNWWGPLNVIYTE